MKLLSYKKIKQYIVGPIFTYDIKENSIGKVILVVYNNGYFLDSLGSYIFL